MADEQSPLRSYDGGWLGLLSLLSGMVWREIMYPRPLFSICAQTSSDRAIRLRTQGQQWHTVLYGEEPTITDRPPAA